MTTLYGPSDFVSVTIPHADGTVHTHKLNKNRHAVPGYGSEVRSLPVVSTNCVDCVAHLKREGFHTNADMVTKTADEMEFEKRAAGEGSLMSRLMAESLGRELAKEAAKNINSR